MPANQTIICNEVIRLLRDVELIVNSLDPVGNLLIAKIEKSQHGNVESQVTNIPWLLLRHRILA